MTNITGKAYMMFDIKVKHFKMTFCNKYFTFFSTIF